MKQTVLILLATTSMAFSSDWMQWRGPELNGTCDAKNLPVSWSLESGENIAWICDLPGLGSSTPIVAGDRIFLTTHAENDDFHALCVDRKSGRVAWKKKIGSGKKAGRGNTMASPSAVTDGKMVWFLFGQGSLAAFSLEGKERWKRDLKKDHGSLDCKFGFSSSPLLYENKLYIPLLYLPKNQQHVENAGQQVMAIDPKTGKTLWTAERPTEAISESFDSYITPVPGSEGIIITGADLVTCHDSETGEEQWRFSFVDGKRSKMWRIISGPVQAGDLTVSAYPRGRKLVALNPDGSKSWDYEGRIPDVCTPAYEDDKLYVLDGVKRYLTCINTQTGSEVWQEKIDSDKGFFASPLVADGKIYSINLAGEVFVYASGGKPQRLGHNPMGGDNCAASVIAVDDALYIRMPDRLVCVRKEQ